MRDDVLKLGFYPGCTLRRVGTACEFGVSVEKLAELARIELVEVPDWNCCGASAAHMTDPRLAIALPGRVLMLAERAGMREVVAPCAACSNRLLAAHKELTDPSEKAKLGLDIEYNGSVKIVNGVQFVRDYVLPRLDESARLSDSVPLACYYGCLLLRPPEIAQFDDPEQPRSMEQIIGPLGGRTVDWAFRTECCGGGFSMSFTELVVSKVARILADAKANGAEAVVVSCPMCHSNLDMRQREAEKKLRTKVGLPIIYLTQLVALAAGADPDELGFDGHFVDPWPVVEKLRVHASAAA